MKEVQLENILGILLNWGEGGSMVVLKCLLVFSPRKTACDQSKIAQHRPKCFPFCATAEENPEDDSLKNMVSEIIDTAFTESQIIQFFTADPKQVKCWQIRRKTCAGDAARIVGKGSLYIQVMRFEDMKDIDCISDVHETGRFKQQWMTYPIQDEDIIFFRS